MRGIAAALGYMHSRGYIHCDVKPQNILIKDNGAPVLLDFGIARTEGVDTTTLIATPHYLAPERAQGVPASPASDLYALGIVLFQVVAGHPPFDGPDVHAIIQQHKETPVPPLPGADPAARVLDEIIARLTAKRPEDRYVSADAVGADLAAVGGNVLHDQPTVAVAPAQTVTNPAPAPGAAAAGPPVATSVGSPPGLAATLLPPRAAPAWRRGWFAILAIPLLLLLGFGIARPRRTQENGTASAPGLSAIVTSAPAASSISTTTQSQVVVPDLIGLQYDTARQMLTQRGLVAQKGETRKDVQVSGTVLQIDPPAGTPVAPNTAVTLQISAGPDKAVAPSAQDNLVKPPNTDNHGENPTNRNPDKGKGEGKEKGKGKH
jgi:serine/threonine-protein kinase